MKSQCVLCSLFFFLTSYVSDSADPMSCGLLVLVSLTTSRLPKYHSYQIHFHCCILQLKIPRYASVPQLRDLILRPSFLFHLTSSTSYRCNLWSYAIHSISFYTRQGRYKIISDLVYVTTVYVIVTFARQFDIKSLWHTFIWIMPINLSFSS
jgi:hypothetical protein